MSPDVAASVRARLLNQAKAKGEEFEFTLTRFAGERQLFRLGASAARGRCLLKGASLLSVWLTDPYRATRDVDLLASGAGDDEAIRSLVTEICAVPCPEDGLRFDLSDLTIETIRPGCFERRGTAWTAEAPRVLAPAFYQVPEIETRWRSYLAAGAVLVVPPSRFEEIGERIIAFLGPVRDSIVAGESLERVWPSGGPWRPRVPAGEPGS